MQVLDRGIFLKLKALAKSRGVTVQELIRVLVIPDWMRKSQEENRRTEDRRRHRRLAGAARRPARAGSAGRPEGRKKKEFINHLPLVWVGEKWRKFFFFLKPPGGGGKDLIKKKKK